MILINGKQLLVSRKPRDPCGIFINKALTMEYDKLLAFAVSGDNHKVGVEFAKMTEGDIGMGNLMVVSKATEVKDLLVIGLLENHAWADASARQAPDGNWSFGEGGGFGALTYAYADDGLLQGSSKLDAVATY